MGSTRGVHVFERSTVVALLAGKRRGYDEFECRRCGVSYRRDPDTCSTCGAADIVHIQV